MKTILTGVKPTGKIHLGNYFGSIKQIVKMQEEFDRVFVFIADYHALNFVKDKNEMQENIFDLMVAYLSVGLDPEKVIFFQQSKIHAHTELMWILSTITSFSFLKRAHAYKDAIANNKDLLVGDFLYPVLMASDILLYDVDLVPVGKDQKQHIEMTRDIADKFNKTFGDTFKLPKEYIIDDLESVPGIDGRKMSKSYNNIIELFEDDESLKNKIMKIVTDSEGIFPKNVFNIHKLIKDEKELKILYDENKGNYKFLKEALFNDLSEFLRPFKEAKEKYTKNKDMIYSILEKGLNIASSKASDKLKEVKDKIGVNI